MLFECELKVSYGLTFPSPLAGHGSFTMSGGSLTLHLAMSRQSSLPSARHHSLLDAAKRHAGVLPGKACSMRAKWASASAYITLHTLH